MSPTRSLRSVGVGCVFGWVNDEAEAEAEALLELDPMARSELRPLIRRLEQGRLRRNKDYKQFQMVVDEPWLYELTLDTTRPRLRLYLVEESHDDGVHAVGLMLAVKPTGDRNAQRERQNRDAAAAYARRSDM
ncbi:hypothetical protein [Isoptericola sp. AK164]|uniref:hypothetical protein n=1 Tax=Isoptericola sp. AK164 TaxID=3024246 RepID=UPI0024185EBC|nr:hypothetical protein [Isoptericola sp. AK164]